MTAFYNEPDPFAAQWLRNLISAGHIAPGIVDERKVQDIEPYELANYTQCHFFAGVGVWSLALRRAGWRDEWPIWTGSCPCQPFSAAGKQKGISDERHLWPFWHPLIQECGPPIVVGEQVASKGGLGWLDLVSADLEKSGYAFGASDLCAAGFGQAHIRQRLYFVGLADGDKPGIGGRGIYGPGQSDDASIRTARERSQGFCETSSMGQTIRNPGEIDRRWLDADWLLCRNPAGKPSWRPVEPGTFPLAHGIAGRTNLLRAIGNALDLETATAFCKAVKEIIHGV